MKARTSSRKARSAAVSSRSTVGRSLELRPQGHAPGPRRAEEGRVGPRLQRLIHHHLVVVLVGQVLGEQLDGPALVLGANADPAIPERELLLVLQRVEVGAGVV